MNKLTLLLLLCSSFFVNSGSLAPGVPTNGEDCMVYIPESISPNGDGINDLFFIETACEYKNYSLRIFSTKNKLVFESIDASQLWDGSENGSPLPQGYYTWVLSFTMASNGDLVKEKGRIALIR